MKNQAVFEQAKQLSEQLENIAETHRKAVGILMRYKSANGRLAHAIDNEETERAETIREEIKQLRQEYFDITMVVLFEENI